MVSRCVIYFSLHIRTDAFNGFPRLKFQQLALGACCSEVHKEPVLLYGQIDFEVLLSLELFLAKVLHARI